MASTWIRPRPTRRSSWWSRWRPVKWSWPSSPSAWPSGRTSAEPNSPADPSADPSRATRDPSGRQQLPRADEDAVEHGLGEAAGRGVLLADVVAAEQRAVLGKGSLGAVGETGLGADGAEVAQRGVPGVVAEGDHHADRVQERQLTLQPRRAVGPLLGERLVVGRRALDRRGDVAVPQLQPVVAGDRGGLVGEAGAPQRGEQPVAGEDAAGAVAAVGGGRQAEDEQARGGVAEAGHRPAPVVPVPEGGALLPGDLLAPGDQARAPAALDQLPVEPLQFVARGHRDSLPRQRGKIIPPVPGRNPRPSLSVT